MSGVHRTQLLPEVQRVGMISRMRSRPGLHPSEGAVPRNFGATARGHANDEPRRLKLNLSTSASFLEVRQEAAKSRSTRGAPGIPTLCCLSGLEGSAYCSNHRRRMGAALPRALGTRLAGKLLSPERNGLLAGR